MNKDNNILYKLINAEIQKFKYNIIKNSTKEFHKSKISYISTIEDQ